MRNRFAAVSAGVALAVFLHAQPAWACECISGTVVQSVDNADLVVLGVVTAMSLDRQMGLLHVQLDVQDTFKRSGSGGSRELYTARLGGSCYAADLRVGREYILFASDPRRVPYPPEVPAGALIVSLCGGTREIGTPEGNHTLEQLRKLGRRE